MSRRRTLGLLLAGCSLATGSRSASAGEPPPAPSKTIELSFRTHDGYPLFGKLTVPATEGRHAVVVHVQTAEGATVDMRRPDGRGGTFDFFDLYRTKLPPMGVAFFSYEGRGIRMGDEPPRYERIDRAVYDTSTLENKVRDVLTAVRVVRDQPGVDPSRILLMGASEGTLIAAEAASRSPAEVHALVLYGVISSTLKDALRYMAADGRHVWLCTFLDEDKDGRITRAEFDADAKKVRERALKGVRFEHLDMDGDGAITRGDLRKVRQALLEAIESEKFDDVYAWARTAAAASIPRGWFEDHFAHAPMWSFLAPLTMPVGLFHGTADALTPVDGVRALERTAKKSGKANLEFHYFDGLDHSLGIATYFLAGTVAEGPKAIFEFVEEHARP
jgi:pimeloyl-ACP methyl ester carboxylesterase